MVKLSVLMPAYNEEATIEKILNKVLSVKLKNATKEIIVVDDGSEDRTAEIVAELAKKHREIKLIRQKNKGKGGAIKTALKHATGDIMIVQDADLEYDPNDYEKLIKPIIQGKAKVVYGNRNHKANKKYSHFMAWVGGHIITYATNILFGTWIRDEPTCYKVWKRGVITGNDIIYNGFEWEPYITALIAKRGYRIHEVNIAYYPRSKQEGKKINYKDGFKALWILLKHRFV